MSLTRSTRWTGAAGLAAVLPLALGGLVSSAGADTPDPVDPPDRFTSAFVVDATPDQVIGTDNTTPTGGDPDGSGEFLFFLNTEGDNEIICWDITTENVDPPYQSAAKTATHIHQTPAGTNGPPRIAFPNPTGDGDVRTSSGCSEGPFTTGLVQNGADTGDGFSLSQIEDNPAGFSADTHTAANVPGAVRGQLVFDQDLLDAANEDADGGDDGDGDDNAGGGDREVPRNGVDTGEGGTAGSTPVAPHVALTLVGLTAAGAVAVRRRQGA